jgi:hypothetical protein
LARSDAEGLFVNVKQVRLDPFNHSRQLRLILVTMAIDVAWPRHLKPDELNFLFVTFPRICGSPSLWKHERDLNA